MFTPTELFAFKYYKLKNLILSLNSPLEGRELSIPFMISRVYLWLVSDLQESIQKDNKARATSKICF